MYKIVIQKISRTTFSCLKEQTHIHDDALTHAITDPDCTHNACSAHEHPHPQDVI